MLLTSPCNGLSRWALEPRAPGQRRPYDGDADHYTKFGKLDFDVKLVDPCIAADLSIDEKILTSTYLTYSIYKEAVRETLDVSLVSSSETKATCPPIQLDVLII